MRRWTAAWLKLWWLVPLLVGAWMCRSHLGFGFVGDAKFLIPENRFIVGFGQLWPNLTHDYFWSSSGNAIPYYRPLTKGSWVVEATLSGMRPIVFHAVQIAWFLVAIAGVMRLGREVGLQRRWAMLAGATFAAHPATVEPVALLMARSDVTAVACSVWSLAMFRAFVRTGRRGQLAAHVAFFALALASKEAALAIVPVLAAWVLVERGRWRTLVPMAATATLYMVVRRLAIGSLATTAMVVDPLRLFVGGGMSLVALAQLGPTTGLRSLSRMEAVSAGALVLSTVAWMAVAAVLVCARKERRRTTAVLVLWMLSSLALVLLPKSMWVPNAAEKIPLADRWLLGSLAAAAIVVARIAQRWLHGRAATLAFVPFFGWIALSGAFADHVRADYRDDGTMLALEEQRYLEIPEPYRTREDRCLASERAVAIALAKGNAALALQTDDRRSAECERTAGSLLNRLAALVQLQRWPEASSTAAALLQRKDFEPRQRGRAAFLAGEVALEMGEPARAEQLIAQAVSFGFESCKSPFYSALAAGALGRPLDAARRFEASYDCLARDGAPPVQLLEKAAALFEEAGNQAESARVRARIRR